MGLVLRLAGLRICAESGQVVDESLSPIPGLFAAGELVGGIFYFNYPGGSGLMSGAVFGRRAGTAAASYAAVRFVGLAVMVGLRARALSALQVSSYRLTRRRR